jgi:arylformamidase
VLIDLSHMIRSGVAVYPGLPAPEITDHLSHEASREKYATGVTFQIGRINMVANTGTAIDAPYHRFPDMPDIAALPLDRIADLDGVVIDASSRAITRAELGATDVGGKAVLVRTRWSKHWGQSDYGPEHPYLTKDAAEHLRDAGAVLVGIDSLNVDDTNDPTRPVHSILLAAGIPIVENLASLDRLPTSGFRFSAVPMRAAGMGAFPVRAWAQTFGQSQPNTPAVSRP